MQRKCKVCDGWHDLDEPWPEKCAPKAKATAFFVISDTMQPLRHMGTGEILDSKAKFRQATRASGCVELGNSLPVERQPIKLDKAKRKDDIRRTIYNIRNGIRDDYRQ